MEKVLTISVAAYNVEKFLVNTLNSLADSRYVDKLEVFVIDDGGNDKSLEIAKEFEQRFPYTFHAIHKENGGYGSTVNYSIKHATGRYFKLLDGDDWMDQNGLNDILDKLKNCQEDVIVSEYYTGPSANELIIVPTRQLDETIVKVCEYETSYPHGMWSLFYRTEMLKESQVVCPEHSMYTDQIYSTVPFGIADSIRFINLPVYCYRFGRTEQSTSRPSRIKHAEEMLSVCKMLYDYYEAHKDGNKYLLSRVSRYYIVALKTLMLTPLTRENRRKLILYETQMKQNHPELYHAATSSNSIGVFVNILRKSHYAAYWLIKFIPVNKFL